MMNQPISQSITVKDIENAAHVMARGLYFFDQLASAIVDKRVSDSHEICDLAFHIRSLAEICSGIPLWFRSVENIKVLSSATLMDFNHLLIRVAKLKRDTGQTLSDFENTILASASDKYYAVCYPDGKNQIKEHRKLDNCLLDTYIMTSKLIHQDEFAILGTFGHGEFSVLTLAIRTHLPKLATFWRKDFIAQTYFVERDFPEILAFHETHFRPLPFKPDVFGNGA
jgi:hypothetical protein